MLWLGNAGIYTSQKSDTETRSGSFNYSILLYWWIRTSSSLNYMDGVLLSTCSLLNLSFSQVTKVLYYTYNFTYAYPFACSFHLPFIASRDFADGHGQLHRWAEDLLASIQVPGPWTLLKLPFTTMLSKQSSRL